MGVVGEHKDFPVENLSLSHCRKYLASCSHDQTIKFWNVENLEKEQVNTYRKKSKKNNKPKPLNSAASKTDFFADLTSSENAAASSSTTKGESDNSDSSDDEDDEVSNNTSKFQKDKVTESRIADDLDDSSSEELGSASDGSDVIEGDDDDIDSDSDTTGSDDP